MRSFDKKQLFLMMILFLFVISYAAKENKVVVYGGVIEYKTDEEMIYVRDGAHIFYSDIEIFADNIQVDVENDKVFALGNVIFWQGQDKTMGEYLEYDNKTGKGYIENAKLVRQQSIMYADSIELSVRKISGKNIIWTTCELDHPHYYLKAKSIDIFPDQVMYAHDMKYVIHGDTIIKQKVYKIDIKPLQEDFKYRYGYSDSKGVWVNAKYNYLLTPIATGWLTWDYTQRISDTISTTNTWKLNNKRDSLGINTSNYSTKDGKNSTANYRMNYRGRSGIANYTFSGTFFSRDNSLTAKNDELNYNVTLGLRMPRNNLLELSNINIYWKERRDPDGSSYPQDDKIRVLDKIPEINLTTNRITLPGKIFNVNMNLLWGKYFEGGPTEVYARKQDEKINISSNSYEIWKLGRLNLSGNINHSRDSKGNDQKTYYTGVSLNKTFFKGMSWSNKWDRRDNFGTSAFSYSTRPGSLTYRSTLAYRGKKISSTLLSFNYDLKADKFLSGIYSDLRLNLNKFEYYLKLNYALNNQTLGDLKNPDPTFSDNYNRLSYNFDKDTYLRFTVPYNRTTGKYTSHYIEGKFKLPNFYIGHNFIEGKRITANLTWRRDLITKSTKALSMDFTIDLHCWEGVIKWDRNRKEGWLEFYVKTDPGNKHRIFYDAEEGKVKPILKRIDTD
ncbi:MAG: hypothetical protein C0601_08535 [Candidatus Muiribacterium halophilum]|uniref:Organic solvent tolerance-like N-terminal domain-containing protein n=1 Tax=Muiribacterium halophilum TaxID=2053465 RepID=A0A2N5ZEF7_MUIH1|nr:MAG: hypothetical protein C0601_08535 [Candidatus Muirbacterium halophilum]